jgi:hypothetical protein
VSDSDSDGREGGNHNGYEESIFNFMKRARCGLWFGDGDVAGVV